MKNSLRVLTVFSFAISFLVGCQPSEVGSPIDLHTAKEVRGVNLDINQHEEVTVNGAEMEEIQSVLLHPVMWNLYMCSEHGGKGALGDRYGKDCVAFQTDANRENGKHLLRQFENDGLENEEWYGWEAPLLAPCDGVVKSSTENLVTNKPGQEPALEELRPAAAMEFKCDTGVQVIYAHIRNTYVKVGDRVKAGVIVAEVGNNGISRSPHVHVGAWRDKTPLQIRFDLRLLNR